MPPSSFTVVNGGEIKAGDRIGEVGGWGKYSKGSKAGTWDNDRYGAHLHYEVWEKTLLPDSNGRPAKVFIPVDPRATDLSNYR
jgi:murein DD-endopeptidase MepM/ murein hydrolase activator NlpD